MGGRIRNDKYFHHVFGNDENNEETAGQPDIIVGKHIHYCKFISLSKFIQFANVSNFGFLSERIRGDLRPALHLEYVELSDWTASWPEDDLLVREVGQKPPNHVGS